MSELQTRELDKIVDEMAAKDYCARQFVDQIVRHTVRRLAEPTDDMIEAAYNGDCSDAGVYREAFVQMVKCMMNEVLTGDEAEKRRIEEAKLAAKGAARVAARAARASHAA